MHLIAVASILVAAAGLCQAQVELAAENTTDNAANHWCGKWAGSPNPTDVPSAQQLPASDYLRRFFVEPQLQRTPFAPVVATEPKVQIPKIWGNSTFYPRQCCVSINSDLFKRAFRWVQGRFAELRCAGEDIREQQVPLERFQRRPSARHGKLRLSRLWWRVLGPS